jgi:hypothetical protein
MTETTETRIINIPFGGFYESMWSGEVDNHQERECEYMEERQGEEGIPPELRLTQSDFADIFFDVTDYHAIYEDIANCYADAFNNVVSEEIGIALGLKFEKMTSPRYYNFETDRLFCYIPWASVQALFAASVADDHKALRDVLSDRHTSYDGFCSHYSNDLETWTEKPLEDWDHNELCSLLCAAMLRAKMKDWEWDIYYAVCDGDGIYQEHDAGVDWKKFDEKVAEKREELREAAIEAHPDLAPELSTVVERCPDTLDMFKD